MPGAQILGGQLTVRGDGGYLVDEIGTALDVAFRPTRSDPPVETEYYGGSLLGIRFTLTVTGHGSDAAYELSYLSEHAAYVADAELVSLDFHIQRLLAAAGLRSETKPRS